MSSYKIGEKDDWGNILRRAKGPVELWETQKGYFLIYLWVVADSDAVHTVRKYREDADALFDSVCDMFPGLDS